MFLNQVLSALVWATIATVISLATSILLIWWLGLNPRRLAHEIDDVQNAGVGATFFIVSLITSLFVSVFAGTVPTRAASAVEDIGWAIVGVLISSIYTLILFFIAHREMAPKGETLRQYIHREIIVEQNAALALFLGGLALAPFLAVLYQIV